MMKLIGLIFLGVLLQSIIGFKRPPGSKCKEFVPVDVNDDWFFKFAKVGMGNPMGTKYALKQGFGNPPPPGEDTTLPNKMCMTANFKILLQKFALQVVFRYRRINEFKAFVRTDGTPAEDSFKLYGDFVMAKTDNSSYVLFFGCLFEAQDFWQVHTPIGTTLSGDSRKAILEHIAKHGFSPAEADISSSNDPIWLDSASISDCSTPPGGAGTVDTAKLPKGDAKDDGSFDALVKTITELLKLKTT